MKTNRQGIPVGPAVTRRGAAASTAMAFALSLALGVAGCAPAEETVSAAADPQTETSDTAGNANADTEDETRNASDADASSTQSVDLGDLTIEVPGSFQCLSDGEGSGYVQWAESAQVGRGGDIVDYIAFLPGEYPDDFETYTESAYRGLYESTSNFPESLGLDDAEPGEVEAVFIDEHPMYLVRGVWGGDKGFLLFVIPSDDHFSLLLLSASLENIERLQEIVGTVKVTAELSAINALYFSEPALSEDEKAAVVEGFHELATGQSSSGSSSSSEGGSSASSSTTRSQSNALQRARDYLDTMPFSHQGLVEQLEFEGYSHSDAVYAADNCGADWYEQAALKAQRYEDLRPFSHSGLVEQLEYEGFTHAQAEYGVSAIGL